MADAILTYVAVVFLGLSVPPPATSWGELLTTGIDDLFGPTWLTVTDSWRDALTCIFAVSGEFSCALKSGPLRGIIRKRGAVSTNRTTNLLSRLSKPAIRDRLLRRRAARSLFTADSIE
jgi:hypothetical protein